MTHSENVCEVCEARAAARQPRRTAGPV